MATSFWQEKAGTGGAEEIEEYGSMLAGEARTRRKKRERKAKKIELIGAGLLLGDQLMTRNAAKKAREFEETTGNALLMAKATEWNKVKDWAAIREEMAKTTRFNPNNKEDVENYFIEQAKKEYLAALADDDKLLAKSEKDLFEAVRPLTSKQLRDAQIQGAKKASAFNKRYDRYNSYSSQDKEVFMKPVKDYISRVSDEISTDPRRTSVLRSLFSKVGIGGDVSIQLNDNIAKTIDDLYVKGKIIPELADSDLDDIVKNQLFIAKAHEENVNGKDPEQAALDLVNKWNANNMPALMRTKTDFNNTQRDTVNASFGVLLGGSKESDAAPTTFILNGKEVAFQEVLVEVGFKRNPLGGRAVFGYAKPVSYAGSTKEEGWATQFGADKSPMDAISFIREVQNRTLSLQEENLAAAGVARIPLPELTEKAIQKILDEGAIDVDGNYVSTTERQNVVQTNVNKIKFEKILNGIKEDSDFTINQDGSMVSLEERLNDFNQIAMQIGIIKNPIEMNSEEFINLINLDENGNGFLFAEDENGIQTPMEIEGNFLSFDESEWEQINLNNIKRSTKRNVRRNRRERRSKRVFESDVFKNPTASINPFGY